MPEVSGQLFLNTATQVAQVDDLSIDITNETRSAAHLQEVTRLKGVPQVPLETFVLVK